MTTRVERRGLSSPLTATRLVGLAALVAVLGAAALAVLSVERSDPAGAVVAVYVAVLVLAVAPLVAAEIRTPAGATAATVTRAPAGVTFVTARAGEPLVVEETHGMLVIDASAGDLRVELPAPSRCRNRLLTFERIDRTDHAVVLEPLGRSLRAADAELRLVVADGAWRALDDQRTRTAGPATAPRRTR